MLDCCREMSLIKRAALLKARDAAASSPLPLIRPLLPTSSVRLIILFLIPRRRVLSSGHDFQRAGMSIHCNVLQFLLHRFSKSRAAILLLSDILNFCHPSPFQMPPPPISPPIHLAYLTRLTANRLSDVYEFYHQKSGFSHYPAMPIIPRWFVDDVEGLCFFFA